MVSVCENEAPSRHTICRWLANFSTGVETAQVLRALGLTALSHPPYSLDLDLSDYTLFNKMKDVVRDQQVQSSTELHAIVRSWRSNTPHRMVFQSPQGPSSQMAEVL